MPDEETIREIVRDELQSQSSTTRRGVLAMLGGGAAAGAMAGSASGEVTSDQALSVGDVTANTYRISEDRYGGVESARSELATELGDADAGAKFVAQDTGAEYHWTGSAWELMDGKTKSFSTEDLFTDSRFGQAVVREQDGSFYVAGSDGQIGGTHADLGSAIQSANDALDGGVIVAPVGQGLDLGSPISVSPNTFLKGAGEKATSVNVGNLGGHAIELTKHTGISDMELLIPDVPDDDIIHADFDTVAEGEKKSVKLRDLRIGGGNEAGSDSWAITLKNLMHFDVENVNIEVGINMFRFTTDAGDFNYGNSAIRNLTGRLESDNLTGVRFAGDTTADNQNNNVNLLSVDYLDVITGDSTSGCVGIDIENAKNITFTMADIEKTDTAVQTLGGVNAGSAVTNISFISPYLDGAVDWGEDTIRPVIIGGDLTQTPTQQESGQSERVARYIGTEGPTGRVRLQRNTELITKSTDGATDQFTLTFSEPLERGPSYYDVTLGGAHNYPNMTIQYATNSKIEVLFDSAPADGNTLEFYCYAEV